MNYEDFCFCVACPVHVVESIVSVFEQGRGYAPVVCDGYNWHVHRIGVYVGGHAVVDNDEIREYAKYHGISIDEIVMCVDCEKYIPIDDCSGICNFIGDVNYYNYFVDCNCFCKWGIPKEV